MTVASPALCRTFLVLSSSPSKSIEVGVASLYDLELECVCVPVHVTRDERRGGGWEEGGGDGEGERDWEEGGFSHVSRVVGDRRRGGQGGLKERWRAGLGLEGVESECKGVELFAATVTDDEEDVGGERPLKRVIGKYGLWSTGLFTHD